MSFHQDRGGPKGGMPPGQHSSPQNYRSANLRMPPPHPPIPPYHYDPQTPHSSSYHGNSGYMPPHSDFMQYPPPPPTEIFPKSPEKIVRRLLRSALHTILLFTRQLGVCMWCVWWLQGAVVSLCTFKLNELISRGQRSRLRGDVKAFMSRHQEELDSYEIQMGSCLRQLCTIFTLRTWRSLQYLNHILTTPGLNGNRRGKKKDFLQV